MRVIPGMLVINLADAVEAKAAVKAAHEHIGSVYMRFATGLCVKEAIEAEKFLADDGISAEIINIHTIKPIDRELIVKSVRKTGKAVTVEEHSVIGGLGSAVCEVLAEEAPAKVLRIGVWDVFGKSGTAEALIREYGLDAERIFERVKEFVS